MEIYEETSPQDISIDEMKDGDIGVITNWSNMSRYLGQIVQRYNDIILTLGKDSGQSFTTPYCCKDRSNLRVRILPKGTLLKI